MLERLAHFVVRRRWFVIGLWIVLTAFGMFSAGQLSSRWLTTFSIPGGEAYEANQHILKTFGNGSNAPMVAVFHSEDPIVSHPDEIKKAIAAAEKVNPGSRIGSYYTATTGKDAYVSEDGHTMFVTIYPAGIPGFGSTPYLDPTRAALEKAIPKDEDVAVNLSGRDAIYADSSGNSGGPSLIVEAAIGVLGALIVLFFVFGTLPAVAMPLLIAFASIMNTFTCVWALTYVTDVSEVVKFLIIFVGLGVAIDYSLLMIFRFRDELREGEDTETALVQTMTHAGHSVIVSGSTVAIGLLAMVIIPLPFIRSIGIGGMLIPLVSVLATITLLPALLSRLGPGINSVRLLPKRFVDQGHPEDGPWGRWAATVVRKPWATALVGLAIVGLLIFYGLQLNPSEAQAKDLPGAGDAINGRAALTAAGISPGVIKPFVVLGEDLPEGSEGQLLDAVKATPGIAGVAIPEGWSKDGNFMLEAFADTDASSKAGKHTISELQDNVLPQFQKSLCCSTVGSSTQPQVTLAGVAPEDLDFAHAVYSNFIWVILVVLLLTAVLLARAFRSIVLPIKAALLNLASLVAAYGIIVFIFQQGHGSETFWGVHATQAIITWIPIMIFAFLFGLSMDYEVFMLTRMREAYDETGDTDKAIGLGLARTGKLVTSAALVLMIAFFSLSLGPGADIKQFGIGLAAGIIFDATVIRALLVPSLMHMLGKWNWWFPNWAARILFVKNPKPPAPASESA